MTEQQLSNYMLEGNTVKGQSAHHMCMHEVSQKARQITAQLNNGFRTSEEIQEIFSELTGKPVNKTFGLFPPFYTDYGKNISVGDNVFINSGCCFQDQGGIEIGDNTLIGQQVVIATLNHGLNPKNRQDLIPQKVVIGKNVWIGAHATILPGVTIGDNSVIGAGAVVSKDIPANCIAVGVPARVVKQIDREEQ